MTITTTDPTQEVQTAIWTILRNDAQLNSLVTNVFDADPENHDYPEVVVPDPTSIPDNTHDHVGRKITIRIHTRVRGDVRSENARLENTIGARIAALLDHKHTTLNGLVSGHTVYMVHHEEARHVPEKDRSIRHRIDRVSVWTTQD